MPVEEVEQQKRYLLKKKKIKTNEFFVASNFV